MAEVDEMVEGMTVRLASPADVRARGRRRRTRRRVAMGAGAVVVAVALGVGTWAELPDGGRTVVQPAVAPNPYVSGRTVTPIAAGDLPLDSTLHWTTDDKERVGDASPLPLVGLGGACPSASGGVVEVDANQYTRTYKGEGGARARHRMVEYDSAAEASKYASLTRRNLEDCELKAYGSGESAYWAGVTAPALAPRPLYVTVTQYGKWISVIEVQNVTQLAK